MSVNELLLIAAGLLALVLLASIITRRRTEQMQNTRNPYVEGLRHLVYGETDLAYTSLREAVQTDTSNIDAYILLGDILRDRGSYERAYKVHRDVTVRSDLSPALRKVVLRSLALDYIALQRWSSAEQTLLDLARLTRGDNWPLLRLMGVYESLGDWDAAYELGSRLLDESEVSERRLARCRVERAKQHIAAGEGHKARLNLKDAVKLDSGLAEAHLLIGDTYAGEERMPEAVEWWEKLVEAAPHEAGSVFDRLEASLYEMGEFSRMAEIYRKHLEANPDSPDAVLALAHLLERKGEVQEAADILSRYREASSDQRRLDQALALLHYRAGENEEALDAAIRACRAEEEPFTYRREDELEVDEV